MTDLQLAKWILAYQREHGWSPTFREMARRLGMRGHGSVIRRLRQMEAAGMIRRMSGRARAIEVTLREAYFVPTADGWPWVAPCPAG